MILRFCSGIGDAFQVTHELAHGIDMDHLDAEVAGEGVHYLHAFVEAQQAVVDEDAGELVADRAMQQRGDHRGIDAAGQAEDHLLLADLRAHLGDRLLDVVGHVPVAAAAADVAHEAGVDLAPLRVCVTSGWNCTA
jgi:hypothetical protein